MSVTHPSTYVPTAHPSDFAARHPQLASFLVAAAIFVVSAVAILAFSGLPG